MPPRKAAEEGLITNASVLSKGEQSLKIRFWIADRAGIHLPPRVLKIQLTLEEVLDGDLMSISLPTHYCIINTDAEVMLCLAQCFSPCAGGHTLAHRHC